VSAPWEHKVRIWEHIWLHGLPIDRVRYMVGLDSGVPEYAWEKVRDIRYEFLKLTEAQAMTLPEPLRLRWRELQEEEWKPYLVLEFDPRRSEDIGEYIFAEGQRARFCCIRVRNRGKSTAGECVGRLTILSPGDKRHLGHYNLHWAFDDPYQLADVARPIDIPAGDYRRLDVAFSLPKRQGEASETVKGRVMTTGKPFTIRLPSDPNIRHHFEAESGGCWIATHLALSTHRSGDQYHLAPGQYVVQVEVAWGDDQAEAECFRVISPSDWRQLSMEVIDRPEPPE